MKPANLKEDPVDRRLAKNQSGKRKVVVVIRERGGETWPGVFKTEGQALPWVRSRVVKGTVLHADEASVWNDLHARYEMKRVDHQQAYSLDGAARTGRKALLLPPGCPGDRQQLSRGTREDVQWADTPGGQLASRVRAGAVIECLAGADRSPRRGADTDTQSSAGIRISIAQPSQRSLCDAFPFPLAETTALLVGFDPADQCGLREKVSDAYCAIPKKSRLRSPMQTYCAKLCSAG